MNLDFHKYTTLEEKTLKHLVDLEREIFEKPLSEEVLLKELKNKRNLLIQIVFENSKPIGYKLGFEFYASDTFFSWSGGIHPSFRKKGIAKKLIEEQHKEAKDMGYKIVRTHTKNKYKEMLVLNIKSGFEITGVYKKTQEEQLGIILEKKL